MESPIEYSQEEHIESVAESIEDIVEECENLEESVEDLEEKFETSSNSNIVLDILNSTTLDMEKLDTLNDEEKIVACAIQENIDNGDISVSDIPVIEQSLDNNMQIEEQSSDNNMSEEMRAFTEEIPEFLRDRTSIDKFLSDNSAKVSENVAPAERDVLSVVKDEESQDDKIELLKRI